MNLVLITSIVTIILMLFVGLLLINDLIHKRLKNKTLGFILIVFLTGIVCSMFPFLWWGLTFGLPSVLLNTLLLTIFFRNKL